MGRVVARAAAASPLLAGAACVFRGRRLRDAAGCLRLVRPRGERRRAFVPSRGLVTAVAAPDRFGRRVCRHERRTERQHGLLRQRSPKRQHEAAAGGVRVAPVCLLPCASAAKLGCVRPHRCVRGAHGAASAARPNHLLLHAHCATSALRNSPPGAHASNEAAACRRAAQSVASAIRSAPQ